MMLKSAKILNSGFWKTKIFNKNEKSEDYSKADLKQRVLFFITIFRLASGLQMLLNLCSNHNII